MLTSLSCHDLLVSLVWPSDVLVLEDGFSVHGKADAKLSLALVQGMFVLAGTDREVLDHRLGIVGRQALHRLSIVTT